MEEGRFLSIVGPSGCGKTTLLRLIDGLIKPDSGRVLMDGRPIEGPGRDRAFVFQYFGLFPWRTALDNIAFSLELLGYPREERYEVAKKYLSLVGLDGFERYYPHELSGGMQQRVGLARALATNPDTLLMDEPFGALDAITKRTLQEELLRIWEREKKTVVYVTHDLEEALLLSDRVAVMTKRPGKMKALIDVGLPRPRFESRVTEDSRFVKLKNELWENVKEEIKGTLQ